MPFTYDLNEQLRGIVTTAIGMIPEAGGLLAGLVSVLWPDDTPNTVDPWNEIKANVEALLTKQIDNEVYGNVQTALNGIDAVIADYMGAVANTATTPTQLYANYVSARDTLDGKLPQFQQSGYEVLLLPLFAQAVNVYLAFLRDAESIAASRMGMTAAELATLQQKLTKAIDDSGNYVLKTYQQGLPTSDWKSLNRYRREMTLRARDFAEYWPYFDPTVYPQGGHPILIREIFSDPQGNAVFSDDLIQKYDFQAEGGRLSSIKVWGRNDHKQRNGTYVKFIAAVQVQWGENSPDSESMRDSGIMGAGTGNLPFDDDNKNTLQPPTGGSWSDLDLKGNAMVEAWGYSGSILDGLGFTGQDGTQTPAMGGQGMFPGPRWSWAFPSHVLSSIVVLGVSDPNLIKNGFGYAAGGVVFGFRLDASYYVGPDGPPLEPVNPFQGPQ